MASRALNYRNLSSYLKQKYGDRLGKICIDAGFTCPNRDGRCGTGGCMFCTEGGSGEHILKMPTVKEQVRRELSLRRFKKYIAYFQSYTNTYAPLSELKEKYDEATEDERIVVLAIGTRPDCIDEDVARLIASYKERLDVWVELGLQSASDSTARLINRGYETATFINAVKLLSKYKIPVVAHMIIGLPGESEKEVYETARLLSKLSVFGVKIHSLYVAKNTALAKLHENGEYTPLTLDEYARLAAGVIARLPSDTVLHRITGDCPSDLLVAPAWNADKNGVIKRINEFLESFPQGSLYKKED